MVEVNSLAAELSPPSRGPGGLGQSENNNRIELVLYEAKPEMSSLADTQPINFW